MSDDVALASFPSVVDTRGGYAGRRQPSSPGPLSLELSAETLPGGGVCEPEVHRGSVNRKFIGEKDMVSPDGALC